MSSGPELHRAHAEAITVQGHVRGAAWNYLALLDRHRIEFHADKCPERGDFPRWYRDKAASWDRVTAAEQRLRDSLATSAMAGVSDFERPPCPRCANGYHDLGPECRPGDACEERQEEES